MEIQSLSVVVPNKKCVNNCKFCVSQMRCEDYKNMMDENLPFYDLYEKDYIKRMEFARDNGCNTVMLTGNSEPQQNRVFLQRFGTINNNLTKPFRIVEMQTTGVLIDRPYLRFLRNHVGVSTISLSISSLNSDTNCEINGTLSKLKVNIKQLCEDIKEYDFNLRLSINLTSSLSTISPKFLFDYCKDVLLADQITFRVLYASGNDTPQDKWIKVNAIEPSQINAFNKYIISNGRVLETLPNGLIKYSVHEMSTILDGDCMSTVPKETLRYMILRENCKLYSKWDDRGSLIF